MQVSADWKAVSNLLTFGCSSAEEVRQKLAVQFNTVLH